MPCFAPIAAWRTATQGILIGKKRPADETSTPLALPCSKCIGCRANIARAWTLRCHLEMQQHKCATFTTLTYDDAHLPLTLQKRDLQLFLKRFRKAITRPTSTRRIRFFACGEYGEKTNRPHYHAIIFGGLETDRQIVDETWSLGRTQCIRANPRTIAYVAGYVAKKYEHLPDLASERVDPTTGEVYQYQKPFLQMSKGIGGHARKYKDSWRSFAVYDGYKLPVPRYLHAAWEATATEAEKQRLREERAEYQHLTLRQLQARERIVHAQRDINSDNRTL